jgi:hypothetical protein
MRVLFVLVMMMPSSSSSSHHAQWEEFKMMNEIFEERRIGIYKMFVRQNSK